MEGVSVLVHNCDIEAVMSVLETCPHVLSAQLCSGHLPRWRLREVVTTRSAWWLHPRPRQDRDLVSASRSSSFSSCSSPFCSTQLYLFFTIGVKIIEALTICPTTTPI